MTDELFICPACNKRKLYVSLVKPGNPWICHNAYCPGIDGKGRRSGLGRELPFSISAPPKEAPKPTKGSDPPESWPLKTGDFELEYLLQERAIEPWVINAMPIRRTATGILFLFPECDYWQERRWKPFPPRWKNMSGEGVGASNGAMYLVRVTHNDTLFLVEGIIDALSIGAFAPAASTLSGTA